MSDQEEPKTEKPSDSSPPPADETPAKYAVRVFAEMLAEPAGTDWFRRRLLGDLSFPGWSNPLLGKTLSFNPTHEKLNKELLQLRAETRDLAQKLDDTQRESDKYGAAKKELEEKVNTLEQKTILSCILSNIRHDAQEKIFQSDRSKDLFEKTTLCESYVLAMDIRRSTELMLKARGPELFAQFIRGLCCRLSDIIIGNYGVFDRFTGDGILAYFPDFYSGPDAGLLALDCAWRAHEFFAGHYRAHRHCFTSVLNEIGLGIGIDFGKTYMVKIQDSLTLVGTPVVYACRLSGANPGETLLNQPAYEIVFEKYRGFFNFSETLLRVKNEGDTVAYRIASNKAPYSPQKPDWDALTEQFSARISEI
jgi:class 3 adenylate cyclase